MTSDKLDLLRDQNNILSVTNKLNLSLKHLDENRKDTVSLHCPNTSKHKNNDKIPSFVLLPRINRYRCYTCGIEGDIFSLIKLVRNCSFPEAIEWIDPKFYQKGENYLKAKEYLNQKGFTKETLEKFKVFTGITKHEDKTFECVYFPIGDGKKYRLIDCDECKYRYSKGTKTQLFKTITNPTDGRVVLCEGEFDAMIGWQNTGYAFWSSTGGAATFYKNWVNDLFTFEEIIVCYDNDDAGKNGAENTIKTLIDGGINRQKIIQIEIPEIFGKDISDYFSSGRDKADFDELIQKPRPP